MKRKNVILAIMLLSIILFSVYHFSNITKEGFEEDGPLLTLDRSTITNISAIVWDISGHKTPSFTTFIKGLNTTDLSFNSNDETAILKEYIHPMQTALEILDGFCVDLSGNTSPTCTNVPSRYISVAKLDKLEDFIKNCSMTSENKTKVQK